MKRNVTIIILLLTMMVNLFVTDTEFYAATSNYADSSIGKYEYFESEVDAGIYLRQSMVKRKTEVAVRFITKKKPSDAISKVFDYALEETGYENEGDYIRFSLTNLTVSYNYKHTKGTINGYIIEAIYYPTYVTTYAQEQKVTKKIDDAFKKFGFTSNTSTYEKVKVIYNFVCGCAEYKENPAYINYSAYGAIVEGEAVCQGYAMLLYRMLLRAGVDNRIVASSKMNHGWNIIKIGNYYYHADATWDDKFLDLYKQQMFFLKGSSDFIGHDELNDEYNTTTFKGKYPICDKEYTYNSSNPEKGETVKINKQKYKTIKWKSIPDKAKVTSSKKIKAKKIKIKLSCKSKITGYQIKYASNKKFKNAKIIATKKSTVTIKKLKLKKYYIKARAYTVVNGKKKYGKWSSVIKVKK